MQHLPFVASDEPNLKNEPNLNDRLLHFICERIDQIFRILDALFPFRDHLLEFALEVIKSEHDIIQART